MLRLQMDTIGDMAVVECKGRIGSSETRKLHTAVTANGGARIVVLDLTDVFDLGVSGVDMLVFLQKWAHGRDIQLKLFNPSRSVRVRLEGAGAIAEFDIAPLSEMMALLALADHRYALNHADAGLHQAA